MNCLTYAVRKLFYEGGYLMIRRSQFAEVMGIKNKWNPFYWTPHFLHRSKDTKIVTQYLPTEEQIKKHKEMSCLVAWFQLWNFDGEIVGDDK